LKWIPKYEVFAQRKKLPDTMSQQYRAALNAMLWKDEDGEEDEVEEEEEGNDEEEAATCIKEEVGGNSQRPLV
jgi:hypothetical protein